MSGILIVAVLLALAFLVLVIVKKSSTKDSDEISNFPYIKRGVLFTPAERSFLGVLNQAVGDKAQIFGKVRVADVITTKKGMTPSERQTAFNKISAKHFDYLLCDPKDISVICAIELNDSSHNTKKAQKRDAFLVGACKSANIPLLQIKAKSSYNINEIQEQLKQYLSPSEVEPENKVVENNTDKTCPKCSSSLVVKEAKKGKNIGNKFWGCSSYPNCRHIEAIG
ncbi:MAG TPA: DUF2726 domain-containing protein [Arcobacter sp.]|nr:DUF2726 domain-containing protein [Arcobacter sp.]